MTPSPPSDAQPLPNLAVAFALALAAAVSLGLARFSYALLLPPMRSDLGWSYLTGGAMNTVNAAGYLVGALLMPAWLRRFGARHALLGGAVATGLLLVAHGALVADAGLFMLRALTGVASAATFVAGGVLAAQLAGRAPRPGRSAPSAGLVLGVYYGGTGVGIVVSALLVPPLVARPGTHAWQAAWFALGAAALAATAVTASATRGFDRAGSNAPARAPFEWPRFGCGLLAYFMFGLGYIGYMTFVVTLLREQRRIDHGVLRPARRRGDGLVMAVGRAAAARTRRRCAAPAQRAARIRDPAAGAEQPPDRGVRVGAAVRRGVPVGRGVDDRAGAAQRAARGVAGRHQRLHDRVRRRPDRRPDAGRLARRRGRRLARRPRVLGRGARARRTDRVGPAAARRGAAGVQRLTVA
jgi:MFS family permease